MSTDSSELGLPSRRRIPFALSSFLWLGLGILVCTAEGHRHAHAAVSAIGLLVLLWAVALLDLIAFAGLFFTLARHVTHPLQNRRQSLFPASYWGASKLACVGLFLTILYQARGASGTALLAICLGLGTLVFVPLVGGVSDFILENHREKSLHR